ncbi:hypothetical protein BJ322DRAFT_358226 [Thelephora terrestris]|uniref:Uncharacterized protein n=1 Tax=Thelephora terrestris TaxID=56493 RepID=A0A9P6L297_9AGAM|nr:hypothetical protein BJ322DRAFT_358226 [Thelephora terrestris]
MRRRRATAARRSRWVTSSPFASGAQSKRSYCQLSNRGGPCFFGPLVWVKYCLMEVHRQVDTRCSSNWVNQAPPWPRRPSSIFSLVISSFSLLFSSLSCNSPRRDLSNCSPKFFTATSLSLLTSSIRASFSLFNSSIRSSFSLLISSIRASFSPLISSIRASLSFTSSASHLCGGGWGTGNGRRSRSCMIQRRPAVKAGHSGDGCAMPFRLVKTRDVHATSAHLRQFWKRGRESSSFPKIFLSVASGPRHSPHILHCPRGTWFVVTGDNRISIATERSLEMA